MLLLFLAAGTLSAQEIPGLTPWDARTATQLLRRSPWVLEREEGTPGRTIWVKSVHMIQKASGWYFLTINGDEVDWRLLFVSYNGRIVNLALLFQYGRQVNAAPQRVNPWFEAPPWPDDRDPEAPQPRPSSKP